MLYWWSVGELNPKGLGVKADLGTIPTPLKPLFGSCLATVYQQGFVYVRGIIAEFFEK